jgi:hypothetical protein
MNRSHIFLKAYAETGSVTRAAKAARIDRVMHYRRLKSDPAYAEAFAAAQDMAVAVMEDEALRRAVEGFEEPVTFKGQPSWEVVRDKNGNPVTDPETGEPKIRPVTVRKYSDSLLQFLLRGAKPEKYRERHQHTHTGDVNLRFKGSLEELLAAYRNLATKPEDDEEGEG